VDSGLRHAFQRFIAGAPSKFVAFVFALCLTSSTANTEEFVGRVGHIRDGDTFQLCIESTCVTAIRICGIDAPDHGQEGFHESAVALGNILKGKNTRCILVGAGTPCDGRPKLMNRTRFIAQCFVDEKDIAEMMVAGGFACDCERYSGGHYSKDGNGTVCPTGDGAPRGCPMKKVKN
jgi:micrococcal nuclease